MKYFGINLRKYTQDIYEENYETLTTKDTKALNKCRDIACSLIEDSVLSTCHFFTVDL